MPQTLAIQIGKQIRRKSLSLRWAGSLILLCFSLTEIAAQTWSPAEKQARREYFHRLTALSASAASPSAQYDSLKHIIANHPRFERAYGKLLERYLLEQNLAEAQKYFQELSKQSEFQRNSFWILGKIALFAHDTNTARDAFDKALSEAPRSPALFKDYFSFLHQTSGHIDPAAEARRYTESFVSALAHYQNEDFKAALAAFQQFRARAEEDGLLLHLWGECYFQMQDTSRAEALWQRGLALAKQHGDLEWQAGFLADLGKAAYLRQNDEQAMRYYQASADTARRTDDLYALQKALGNLGKVSYRQGKISEALSFFKQDAIPLAEKVGADEDLIEWRTTFGQILYELGDHQSALQHYNAAEKLAQQLRKEQKILDLQIRTARVYILLQNEANAKSMLETVRDSAIAKNYLELQHRAEVALADIIFREGKFLDARAAYQKFLDYLNATGNRFESHNYLARLADTYSATGQQNSALTLYQQAWHQARGIESRVYFARYLLDLAAADIQKGDDNNALQKLATALPIAESENALDLLAQMNILMGDAHSNLEDYEQAISSYQRAAGIIEELRKTLKADELRVGYFQPRMTVYQGLVESFLARYETNKSAAALDSIFFYLQMSQGRALSDLISRKNAPKSVDTSTALGRSYLGTRARLQSAQRQALHAYHDAGCKRVAALRDSLLVQRLQLVDHDQSNSASPLALSSAFAYLEQAQLGLLIYYISDYVSFVFAASGNQARIVTLDSSATKAALVAAVDSLLAPFHQRRRYGKSGVPFRAELAHRLYRMLVQPVAEKAMLPERILIVPDLALVNLPFEMLLVEPPRKAEYTPADFPDYAEGFLINEQTFVYSPMLTFLTRPAHNEKLPGGVMVFANPFEDSDASPFTPTRLCDGRYFEPLPYSSLEARKIKRIYPQADTFMHAQATEAEFIRNAYKRRVIHFASHAYIDTVFEAFSGLVLAMSDSANDDGILMGYEIADLELRADLVALSACETGLGKPAEGEGVLGLPRLFLRAGANSVLMTLWQVHDKFAAELMPKFYDLYLNQNLSKAEALAQAKRALLQERKLESRTLHYQHPFYWAAFTLYGDPGQEQAVLSPAAKIAVPALVILLLGAAAYFLRVKIFATTAR